MYRNSLVHGDGEGGGGVALPGAAAKKQYNRNKRRVEGDFGSSEAS